MTEEQVQARQKRLGQSSNGATAKQATKALTAQDRLYALGRLKTGEMNKTEEAFAAHLEARKQAGEILWWKFEGIKLRLADNTFLTTDFNVMAADGVLEMWEIKGGLWQDDSRAKTKIAASLYPFRFFGAMPIAKKNGGGWKVEEF